METAGMRSWRLYEMGRLQMSVSPPVCPVAFREACDEHEISLVWVDGGCEAEAGWFDRRQLAASLLAR